MKAEWLAKYRSIQKTRKSSSEVLTAFNANIDRVVGESQLDLEDVDAEAHSEVETRQQLRETIKKAKRDGRNLEVESTDSLDIEGELSIGGQAGIASNFLSRTENTVIFYTPFLSEDLASMIDEKVLFPTVEGKFILKNVRDCSNTDRTKINTIVEYNGENSGRVIFSKKMKGFGPYFRKGIEENLDTISEDIDRAFLSGFHDVEGNAEAKLEKSTRQLEMIDAPKHLEYVHSEELADKVIDKIFPKVDSLGMDEDEALEISKIIGHSMGDKLTLGDAFKLSKRLIEDKELDRVHIHTYRYHVEVNDTEKDPENIRSSMLFGELAALTAADTGELPSSDQISSLDIGDKIHLHRMDELEGFENFFELENFSATGTAEIEGLTVVAIPTLIHENPKRVVGMGDVISSGAWTADFS